MKTIQSIRGMNDLLPEEASLFLSLSAKIKTLFESYQFEPLLLPLLEKTELFARSIGDATDIVEKEMYTFTDRNDDSLTLRPEGTAGVVRACLEHGLIHNQIRKFWFIGPMFRHERPQKGRYRQFYQLNAETFGIATPDVEAESLSMLQALWQDLGLSEHMRLEINTIGTSEERKAYRKQLVAYLSQFKDQLDADSQRRLDTNPLRILDSKDPQTQSLLNAAPRLVDCLSEISLQHYRTLKSYLDALGISYIENPKLVRGLDYYCHTVFEWTTDLLGAQATVCGGGRYDGLVEQLGGKPNTAFGFAMGMERLMLLVQQCNQAHAQQSPDVFIMTNAENLTTQLALAKRLRHDGFQVVLNLGGGSAKSQWKRAEKSQAKVTLDLDAQIDYAAIIQKLKG